MNDFASEDVIHSYPWRPVEASLAGALFQFAIALLGVAIAEDKLRIFFAAMATMALLDITLRSSPTMSARTRGFIHQLPVALAGMYFILDLIQDGGDSVMTIPLVLVAFSLLWDSIGTPNHIDLRWRSLRIGRRVISYESIQSVELLGEPKRGARAVIHLRNRNHDSLPGRVFDRRHGKVDVCVTRRDAQAFARQLRRLAHLDEAHALIAESKKARAVRSLSPWS